MTQIEMPTVGDYWPVAYRLERQQQKSALKGGIIQVREDGPSFWTITYEVAGNLTDHDYGIWQAWIDSLKGGIVQFKAWARKWPIAYPGGVMPNGFDGTASYTGHSGNDVFLGNMPEGFVISAGDLFTTESDGLYRMHRVITGAVANAGGTATVTIDPPVHPLTVNPSDVFFASPHFTAQIQSDADLGSPILGKRGMVFTAVQRLKP